MIPRIGILGTGHIATFVCRGLRRMGWQGNLIVSPHNNDKASLFSERFNAVVGSSNQDVVDQSDIVMVSVRAGQQEILLSDVIWPDHVVLLSVMAGVTREELETLVGDQVEIVRAMPVSAAEIGKSPTVLFPAHSEVQRLLSTVGSVIPFGTEAEFEAATINAAVYGWLFDLIDELITVNISAGLSADQSREVVAGTLEAASAVAAQSHVDSGQLIRSLATPGGITEQGLNVIQSREANVAWSAAFQSVLDRIRPEHSGK